jgi:hypothetical protein
VKSNGHGRADVPFFLYLRDASMHIASMQDNKKFADDISDSLVHTKEDADHKFTVSVPKSENYFPVLRYKCVPELRPVPIVSCSGNQFESRSRIRFICIDVLTAVASSSTFSVYKHE